MSAMSDARLAEITQIAGYQRISASAVELALAECLAEIERLRTEPQAWHANTLGYVLVHPSDDVMQIVTDYDDDGAPVLYPTPDIAAGDARNGGWQVAGWQVAPVFPMSVIGGADHG